jgi:hypothetical protein
MIYSTNNYHKSLNFEPYTEILLTSTVLSVKIQKKKITIWYTKHVHYDHRWNLIPPFIIWSIFSIQASATFPIQYITADQFILKHIHNHSIASHCFVDQIIETKSYELCSALVEVSCVDKSGRDKTDY